jgi:hypothetical protein
MSKRIREFHSKHRVLSSQVNEAFEERFNELDSRPEPPEKANRWKVPHNFRFDLVSNLWIICIH